MLPKLASIAYAAPLLLAACTTPGQEGSTEKFAHTTLLDATGKSVGEATFIANGNVVELAADVFSLSPGDHGIHVHTTGKCDAPAFTTAGGHLNPDAHKHGTMNPAGPHMGDLPNITVGANGAGSIRTTLVGASENLRAAMFDADGSAVVVHAGPDDYKSDPAGNSGGRIACGVVEVMKP
ncbi:MAG: superoxide dismutase [Novosphingobium sp. 17-62-19]|uniref:superoxide dismutase family protein n=1 Tax=Novosphingobium sp. 17-62-19 TaxID=1970406 RepID=UPI000BD26549|nr:superoxide dismutase family protein [Novosphingobium sp. 17-62-19]OYX96140.1 MAG: superoxide dismutase [Novosphingobium sp. 35-62-5]OZA17868.1 MAG: superoxide dismutase [Novosphingobium sp. 17-62-19]HQS97686.1 superoxide dismutase family protein [Novosphingobium sp.]